MERGEEETVVARGQEIVARRRDGAGVALTTARASQITAAEGGTEGMVNARTVAIAAVGMDTVEDVASQISPTTTEELVETVEEETVAAQEKETAALRRDGVDVVLTIAKTGQMAHAVMERKATANVRTVETVVLQVDTVTGARRQDIDAGDQSYRRKRPDEGDHNIGREAKLGTRNENDMAAVGPRRNPRARSERSDTRDENSQGENVDPSQSKNVGDVRLRGATDQRSVGHVISEGERRGGYAEDSAHHFLISKLRISFPAGLSISVVWLIILLH